MPNLSVQIYSRTTPIRHPVTMIREMLVDCWAGRELAWRLFVRDLSAQYRQTILGYAWVFLPPLASALTFVFLNSQGIVRIEGVNVPYAAFAMMGTLLWQVFVDALQMPSQAIAKARPMLAKINFPREAILMAGVYLVGFNFLVRSLILVGVMLWWKIVPGANGFWFFPAVAALITCGLAFGMVLAPIGSLYGDISRGIPIVAGFWMLLTPVLYPPSASGMAAMVAKWNPASPLIVTARQCLTGKPFTMFPEFLLIFGLSILVLVVALLAFRIAMPHLIARMGG